MVYIGRVYYPLILEGWLCYARGSVTMFIWFILAKSIIHSFSRVGDLVYSVSKLPSLASLMFCFLLEVGNIYSCSGYIALWVYWVLYSLVVGT